MHRKTVQEHAQAFVKVSFSLFIILKHFIQRLIKIGQIKVTKNAAAVSAKVTTFETRNDYHTKVIEYYTDVFLLCHVLNALSSAEGFSAGY